MIPKIKRIANRAICPRCNAVVEDEAAEADDDEAVAEEEEERPIMSSDFLTKFWLGEVPEKTKK